MIGIDLSTRTIVTDDGRSLPFESTEAFALMSELWIQAGWDAKYVYSFTWLGRPIIQLPDDLVRLQEAVYAIAPDVVLETGIAHGGSLVFYASLLRAIGKGRVIGVDIDIRAHNRAALDAHPLRASLELIEGSSIAPEIVAQVHAAVHPGERVMLVLDSNHLREHVLAELRAYADLVAVGSYIVVADTIMERVAGAPRTKPDWPENNPTRAIDTFLTEHPEFERSTPPRPFDESGMIDDTVTYFRGGWLKRIR